MTSLDVHEARHRRRDTELVGIGRVDARDQRLRDALEGLDPEAAAYERAEALILAAERPATARQHQVQRHAGLAAPRE